MACNILQYNGSSMTKDHVTLHSFRFYFERSRFDVYSSSSYTVVG